MISRNLTYHGVVVCALWMLAILPACGGGGGGGGSGGGTANPTNTPVQSPGQSTTLTPSPGGESTPTPGVIISGPSIVDTVRRAPAGSFILVKSGSYGPVSLNGSDVADSITLFADVTGEYTGAPAGVVMIAARGAAAISLTDVSNMAIDGFTLTGATEAGLLATNSPGTVVTDCIVKRGTGDGLRLTESDDSLVFNNLVWDNRGAGIRVLGSTGVSVINNTVYKNADTGLFVGLTGTDIASGTITAENNIFNKNTKAGISVDSSTTDFFGNFNFNTDGYKGTTMGSLDVDPRQSPDPLFVAPGIDDDGFRLAVGLVGSTSPAIDAGDSGIGTDLVLLLEERTTQTDGALDVEPVDLGYHYLPPVPTPSPTLRSTPTRTPTPTRTATPTRTPTVQP
jgi:parallel beta-helix repeat protein